VVVIVAGSVMLGVTAFAFRYLSSSLSIPGPAQAATTEVLLERGADRYLGFCGNTFEPRFWPECLNGADEWRARGADRLVAFCTRHQPSRLFTARDCESDDRPAMALTDGPRPEDLIVGATGAAVAFAVLVGAAALRRVLVRPGRQD
jgi:hypothetical protein